MPYDPVTPPPVDDALIGRLADEFAARAAEHDAKASFPYENFRRLAEFGLPGLVTPLDAGGKGGGLRDAVAVVGGLARGEPSTALVLVLQYALQAQIARNEQWPPALRQAILSSAAAEGALINILRVEPELGTPHRGGLPATVARKVPGGWRISGTKLYSTGIPVLSWLAVWGRTDEENPRTGVWVLPRQTDNIEVRETWNHIGMRASGSHEVVFHDAFVADDGVADIRPPADWATPDPVNTAWLAALFSAVYDGIARQAREWVVGFLKTRTPSGLGAPLATVPRLQEALGVIEGLLQTNRLLLQSLATATDAGTPPSASDSLLIKYTVTNNAIEAVAKAVEITGNPGLSRDNPLERHYRDVLCARVHAPQNDQILTGAGKAALAG